MRLSPWITFIIGVLIGLLIGWLLDLLLARSRKSTPDRRGPDYGQRHFVGEGEPRAVAAPAERLDQELVFAPTLPPKVLPPKPAPDVEEVNWSQVSASLQETGADLPDAASLHEVPDEMLHEAPEATPRIGAQIPADIEAPEPPADAPPVRLTPDAIEALVPGDKPQDDDLSRIEGIGPVYHAKLRAAGIRTFAALAAADEDRLAEIIQASSWQRVNYGEWIEQARLASVGDETGLRELQERLFRRKQ
jgi:predicted flap endonuclease-1-like 5' DNA nuclease